MKEIKLRTFTFVVGMSLFIIRRENFAEAVAFIQVHFKGTPNVKLQEIQNLNVINTLGKGQVTDFECMGADDFDV